MGQADLNHLGLVFLSDDAMATSSGINVDPITHPTPTDLDGRLGFPGQFPLPGGHNPPCIGVHWTMRQYAFL